MPAADSGSPYRAPPAFTAGQSLTLHIGVLEQPYRASTPAAKGKRKSGGISAMTTGDVASILEAKYGLFSAFARVAEKDIGAALENSMAGAVENLVMGHATDPWGSATQVIGARFRDFINTGESERAGIPGTPTKAALRGVNHRLKHPYRRSNPRRPSFRDTGLLGTSGRAWID